MDCFQCGPNFGAEGWTLILRRGVSRLLLGLAGAVPPAGRGGSLAIGATWALGIRRPLTTSVLLSAPPGMILFCLFL